jgi:bifunctional N-acetylglucosamine-1-phosphate-uridyltransferase/glucosamine-1-phosphate-acetyltransferase GlmU-like protein
VLTCGCQVFSIKDGIFAKWESTTRECEPATAYGMLCADHVKEYSATVEDKEWIDLTQEEIGEIYRTGWKNNMDFAEAIQNKLREKNKNDSLYMPPDR